MRISRFCEARGWYEADNSIESKIFCFGDNGPSGDSSSTAASEDIGTKDVDKGPTSGPNQRDDSGDRQAYEDRFGGVSTRNFNMDTSQNFVDTDQGRVYGTTETLSKGMASGDISPSGDQATADFTAGVAPSEPSIADYDTTNVPEFDEPAGAVSMYGIPGVTPPGSYAPTSITESVTARGPGLSYDPGLDYESQAYNVSRTPSTSLGPAGALGIAAARDNFRARGLDITGNIDSVTGQPVPGSGTGTRDVSTTIDPMDMLDPFGDGFMTDEQRAASNAEIAATNARIDALRGASPAEQITAQARQPVDMSPQQGRVVSETVLGEPRTAAPETSYTGVGSLNYSPAPTPDPLGESVDRAISDFAGYREGQTRTQTPDGVVVDDFMLTRDLVSQPTEYGAAYSPLEQLRMQEGTRTVPAVNVPDVDVFGMTIPTSIAGRIVSDVLTPASALDRALQDPDTRAIYDAQGRIEGAVDKYGTVYDATPYDFESSEAMKQAYAEQSRRQEAERGGGDGGQATVLPPAQEVVPEPPPEDYRGRDIVSGYQYQPRGPINYAYTGLPSLAPQVLRPSYQARGQYAPLFPMGDLRRS